MRSSLLLAALALATTHCAVTSPAIRAAEQGQYEGARTLLSGELAQGRLGPREAEGFARAVAKGEIAGATGDEGVLRIRGLERCARGLDSALGERAGTRDAVGAAAAMVLVEAGVRSASRYDTAFRPLGARTLTSHGDGELRRGLIGDPDEEVRRNALHAAAEAADPDDVEPVLEAARVDPYPAARAQAILAAGAIGGERVVLALKDLWARADTPAREAIVTAWAGERSRESGGGRELAWVVDTQHGPAALAAAEVLVATGSGEAAGVLERAIKDGPTADRVRAIEHVPFDQPALREAVAKAETDPDEAVVAAALGRRLEAPEGQGGAAKGSPARDAIVTRLLALAAGTGGGSSGARRGLARARVAEVVPILERDGAAHEPKTRAEAGTTLAMLGDVARAAVVAADKEPSVRVAVACAILRDWSRRQ
jgi:HEAT repeat protein